MDGAACSDGLSNHQSRRWPWLPLAHRGTPRMCVPYSQLPKRVDWHPDGLWSVGCRCGYVRKVWHLGGPKHIMCPRSAAVYHL